MNLTLKESLVTRSRVFSPWTAFYFLQSLLINLGLGYPFSCSTPPHLRLFCFAMANIAWRTKSSGRCQFAGGGLLFPFCSGLRRANFNTLLALHSTNMEESTEILTIFPWYSYLVGLFIFALGVIAIRRKKESEKARWNTFDSLCLVFSVATFLLLPCKTWPGAAYLN